MGPPASHRVTRVRWYSGYCRAALDFVYGTVTLFGLIFQTTSTIDRRSLMQSSTPSVLLQMVWPISISLAATLKIDVSFSSSAYLDVSVQRVSLHTAMYLPYGD